MNRILRILVREYLENVRTKAFLVGVFLTPVLMALTFIIPALSEKQEVPRRTIAVADVQGTLGPEIEAALVSGASGPGYDVERIPLDGTTPEERETSLLAKVPGLSDRVKEGKLFGYLVVRPSAILRARGGSAPASEFRTGTLTDVGALETVKKAVRDATNRRIGKDHAVPERPKP